MDSINELKELANVLDRHGLVNSANLIDKYLLKLAQNAPAGSLPETPEEVPSVMNQPIEDGLASEKEDVDPREIISRTTFLQLKELRDFFVRHLQDFGYLGSDNIKTIQAAVDQLVTMYRVLLRNMSKDYNEEILQNYKTHIKSLGREADRSKKMKLTPVKVKVDKFIFYDEFNLLLKKIERLYDSGLKELQPVLKKARAVRDAFANILTQTSEQIAHADLIEEA